MASHAQAIAAPVEVVRPRLSRDDRIMRGFILLVGLWMVVVVVLPLYFMLSKSFENRGGDFIGLANYASYFSTPALFYSIGNSLTIAAISTSITISLALIFAYALTRSCMVGKGAFRVVAMIPLLAPSLLPGSTARR